MRTFSRARALTERGVAHSDSAAAKYYGDIHSLRLLREYLWHNNDIPINNLTATLFFYNSCISVAPSYFPA